MLEPGLVLEPGFMLEDPTEHLCGSVQTHPGDPSVQ